MSSADLAFIGDIHGEARPLGSVLDALGGVKHLVFLGDYVNRGPDSKLVIEMLLQATVTWPSMVTILRGNHEEELLRFLSTGNLARFIAFGGLRTIASYTAGRASNSVLRFMESFPPTHHELLVNLADYFERQDVFASHCGVNPKHPSSRERGDVVMGSHQELFQVDVTELAGKSVVCGHYVQRGMTAFSERGLYAIDTGCGSMDGAPLSVFLWPEKRMLQFGGSNACC